MVEKVAYNYSYAMANYQVDEAQKYATEETKSTTLTMARNIVAKVDSNYIKSDTPASIEIVEVRMLNDTSAVATYHKKTPIKDFSDTLELRKRDGQWYAHVIPLMREEPEQKSAPSAKSPEPKSFQEPIKKGQ